MPAVREASIERRPPVRRRWRVTPRFWLILMLLFGAYMAYAYITGFIEIARLERAIAAVEEEIERVTLENEALRRELARLQSPEYIEKVAREELGLVMPGETAVIIAEPAKGSGAAR